MVAYSTKSTEKRLVDYGLINVKQSVKTGGHIREMLAQNFSLKGKVSSWQYLGSSKSMLVWHLNGLGKGWFIMTIRYGIRVCCLLPQKGTVGQTYFMKMIPLVR